MSKINLEELPSEIVRSLRQAQNLPEDNPERLAIVTIAIYWLDTKYQNSITRGLIPQWKPLYEEALKKAETNLNNYLNRIDLNDGSTDQIFNRFKKVVQKIIQRRCHDLDQQSRLIIYENQITPYILENRSSGDQTDLMETLIQEEDQNKKKIFRQYLIIDPEDKLKNYVIAHKKRRKYTVKDYIDRKFFQSKTYEEIALEFDIPRGTLSSDWDRYIKPLLKEIYQSLNHKIYEFLNQSSSNLKIEQFKLMIQQFKHERSPSGTRELKNPNPPPSTL